MIADYPRKFRHMRLENAYNGSIKAVGIKAQGNRTRLCVMISFHNSVGRLNWMGMWLMMNVLIIGTGKLGYEVYRRVAVMPECHVTLLDHHRHDHDVSLATQLIGDATSVEDLKRALVGIDVVFSTVGITQAETFATALVQAMDEVGVKRLLWTTQFQINADQISEAMYDLANREFGFSREVETNYVAGQKAGAAVIKASDLAYTLLECHFFKYTDEADKLIVESAENAVSGGPLSIFSLATLIADMVLHNRDYPQHELLISARPKASM